MESLLKQLMTRTKETTYSMALVVGIPQPQFHRILVGDATASAEVAEKIAKHFGMKVPVLFNASRFVVAIPEANAAPVEAKAS